MAPGVSRRATRARTIRARAPARCGARGVHRPTEPSRASRRARARRNWSRRAIRRRGVRLRRENNEKTEGRARIDPSTRGPAALGASRENNETHAGSVSIVSSEEPRFHRRSSGFIGDRERVHRSNRPRVPNVPVRSKPVVRSRPVVQKTTRRQSHARAGTNANRSSLPPSLASLITSSSS